MAEYLSAAIAEAEAGIPGSEGVRKGADSCRCLWMSPLVVAGIRETKNARIPHTSPERWKARIASYSHPQNQYQRACPALQFVLIPFTEKKAGVRRRVESKVIRFLQPEAKL